MEFVTKRSPVPVSRNPAGSPGPFCIEYAKIDCLSPLPFYTLQLLGNQEWMKGEKK